MRFRFEEAVARLGAGGDIIGATTQPVATMRPT
jgi:hypothetical protein